MQGQNINRNLKGNDCCVIKSQKSMVTMSGFDYFSIADVKVMEIYSLCMALESYLNDLLKEKM